MKIEKVSLIGLGAIGGTFASQIHRKIGSNLRIIVDKKRKARYELNGITVNDKVFNFNYVLPGKSIESSDLVLISVKYHHLNEAIESIKKHVGPETIILSLLNGIDSEIIIKSSFPENKVLKALVFKVDAKKKGNRINHSLPGTIAFGEDKNENHSDVVKSVKDFFESTKISYEIPKDMIRKVWWKFMVNVGINQVSAVLRANYGVFQSSNEARLLLKETMEEVIMMANVIGIDLSKKDIQIFMDLLDNLSPSGETSMLQDILAHRKTEVEMFSKALCDMADEHNLELPVNRMLYRMIKVIEENY